MRPGIREGIRRLAALAVYVGRRFDADGAFNTASSLSYTSLLSLVPLLAIGLAILAAFPAFDNVRDSLQATVFRYVVPEVGLQLLRYVGVFVANAGKLTTAGVVGLTISAIMVLVTIESSFNHIFRVETPRSPASRLAVYWTALTLGPLMMAASFSLWAWLAAAGGSAVRVTPSPVLDLLTAAVPVLLVMTAFSLLYRLVPNRRVAVRDAVAGGVVAGLAFAVLRSGFGFYVANARTYQSIYGAVATVPIVLFWMYLSWMVVLAGAELAAALPEWRLSRDGLSGALPPARRLALALRLLAVLRRDARRSGRGSRSADLPAGCRETEADVAGVLDRLIGEGFVIRTEEGLLAPGLDPGAATLLDLVRALGLGLSALQTAFADAGRPPLVGRRLAEAARAEAAAFDLPLAAVLDETAETLLSDGFAAGDIRREAASSPR
ncbi:MAG: YihY family inner membrane protein [Telmatospirillum sp.]|nr:YihY family inner membrane protein [Telmatospirillum sp.]